MFFGSYAAAEAYLKASGRNGHIYMRRYEGTGYDFVEYEVCFS